MYLIQSEILNNIKQVSIVEFLQKQTLMCFMMYNLFCRISKTSKGYFESNKTYIVPRSVVFYYFYS